MSSPTSYTMFQEEWWLNAAAPGTWDAVEVEKGGEIQAKLAFSIEEPLGATVLTQPALTQSLGPWVKDTGAGYTKSLSREMSLYQELIQKLPKHDVFNQHFAPQVTNWLPFFWEGFTQTTKYTYTLDLQAGLDALWQGMDKRNRRQLRVAQESLVAEPSDDLEAFLDLNEATFNRQHLEMPYTRDYVYRIDAAIQKNAKRWIILARDRRDGVPHAGIYMAEHDGYVYSLMSGADPALRDQNGGIVARWKAIETAYDAQAEVLDFQGSMLRTVERRNRNYGAIQVPYFAINRTNGVLEAKRRLRKIKRAPLVAAWKLKERASKSFR